MQIKSNINNLNLKDKRVFLRADLNVPMKNGKVLDNFRIKSILPTIDLILKKGGKIILATHIDKPKQYEETLSTKNLISEFEKLGYKIDNKNIVILENLRFDPRETSKNENEKLEFAHELKNLADFYINDAFGVLHRNDTSITTLPQLFPKANISIGPLIEKEIKTLDKLIEKPDHPFLLILGGAKVKDKLSLLENMLNIADTIVLCPAVVFTVLKSLGKDIGNNLVESDLLEFSKKLITEAKEKNVKILYSQNGELDKEFIKLFKNEIKTAKTIFFNGLFGFLENKESLKQVNEIFESISESNAFKVIAGGDSVAAVNKLGYQDKMDYLSTGGGAALTYISGKELPGLNAFN